MIILVVIAIPSFQLLYFEADDPQARRDHQGDRQAVVLDLRISGRRCRLHLRLAWACPMPTPPRPGEPRLLGVDNVVVCR